MYGFYKNFEANSYNTFINNLLKLLYLIEVCYFYIVLNVLQFVGNSIKTHEVINLIIILVMEICYKIII